MKRKLNKPYSKPQIEQVNLIPQEAVLVGCKTAAIATGKVAGANNCSNKTDWCEFAVS